MNGFLLDTNVISDLVKGKRANRGVTEWLSGMAEDSLYLSALTIGEIEKGIILAEKRAIDVSQKRIFLDQYLPNRFKYRILAFDVHAAKRWGRIMAGLHGDAISENSLAIDGQIAAIAEEHGLTVCTRNVGDFHRLGFVNVHNPFVAAD